MSDEVFDVSVSPCPICAHKVDSKIKERVCCSHPLMSKREKIYFKGDRGTFPTDFHPKIMDMCSCFALAEEKQKLPAAKHNIQQSMAIQSLPQNFIEP